MDNIANGVIFKESLNHRQPCKVQLSSLQSPVFSPCTVQPLSLRSPVSRAPGRRGRCLRRGRPDKDPVARLRRLPCRVQGRLAQKATALHDPGVTIDIHGQDGGPGGSRSRGSNRVQHRPPARLRDLTARHDRGGVPRQDVGPTNLGGPLARCFSPLPRHHPVPDRLGRPRLVRRAPVDSRLGGRHG